MGYVLSLDLGTTALKLLLLDRVGKTAFVVTVPYPTSFPRADYIQQDPAEWVRALREGTRSLWEQVKPSEIEAIGFAGHMSSVVLVDGAGEPAYPCLTLADGRSVRQAAWLNGNLREPILKATGNLPLNAFALPKLLWLSEEEPQAFANAHAWMSAKDYLRLWLTGETAQEVTDACNSLCVDLVTRRWNPSIIEAAGLQKSLFPRLLEPYEQAGTVTPESAALTGLVAGTPVYAGGADMACGALAMGLGEAGDASVSMGTNAPFMMMTDTVNRDFASALTYHAGVFAGQVYALGSHFNGGLAVNCFSKLFSEDGRIDYDMIGALAREAETVPAGCNGVMTLPFFAGSGSPYFSPADRATMIGVNAATTRAELFRSILEGVALNLRQSLEIMQTLCPGRQARISLFGGGTNIPLWPRIIAEVFGLPVSVVANPNASAIGGALLAGYGVGLYPDPRAVAQANLPSQREIEPDPAGAATYRTLYARFQRFYEAVRPLYEKP